MGKVFASESELNNVKVFAVIRLIHNYTPSYYDKPASKCTKKELNNQIHEEQ